MDSTIQEAIVFAEKELRHVAGDLARKEAQILLCHVLNTNRAYLIANPKATLTKGDIASYFGFIRRRQESEPIAKILGVKEFWSLPFKVTKDTLDPRPDTEILIESVLQRCEDKQKAYRILDLGTGTGCVILSLLYELNCSKGTAVDSSAAALKIARENAVNLGLDDRLEMIESDWAAEISGKFDIIVSNPPYISEAEYVELSPSVRLYDPRQALVSGPTGLEDYKKIALVIHKHLACSGFFAIEIGINQEFSVQDILKEHNLIILEIRKDLAGITRCIVGQLGPI